MTMATERRRRSLSELVEHAREGGRVSYRDMSARADRAGYRISHSQLAEYAAGTVRKAPDQTMIDALAAALGVPRERVQASVFEQWYGYTPRGMPAGGGVLLPVDVTEDEREELERLVAAWLAARRDTNR